MLWGMSGSSKRRHYFCRGISWRTSLKKFTGMCMYNLATRFLPTDAWLAMQWNYYGRYAYEAYTSLE